MVKAVDLKSTTFAFVGSNPTAVVFKFFFTACTRAMPGRERVTFSADPCDRSAPDALHQVLVSNAPMPISNFLLIYSTCKC